MNTTKPEDDEPTMADARKFLAYCFDWSDYG